MSEGKKNIIGMLLEEYDIKSAKDIEDALKGLLGGTIQEMLESEMDEHLGYQEYERSSNPDYRNGRKTKKIRGNFGETEIEVPQYRQGRIDRGRGRNVCHRKQPYPKVIFRPENI